MKEINNLLREYNLKPKSYIKKGKALLVKSDTDKIVIKPKTKTEEIYKYLKTRNFNYYPKIIKENNDYRIIEYIEEIKMPKEQKMQDMIALVSLLHNKTTFYKDIDNDEYQKIYEDILGNIEYLDSYYSDLITIIESKEYMSPSEYLLARNINKIFSSINYSYNELKIWQEKIEKLKKMRYVVLHNNLDIDHYIRNENQYLISWEKSKVGIPIFDLYKLYKKSALDYNFESILKHYEKNYPLLVEEKMLLFILISLPNKLQLSDNLYNNTKSIRKIIDMIDKTKTLIEENSKEKEYQTENK